jgi:diguanylate cyclase (GGDEF)-like protein
MQDALQHLADHDMLSGLWNRRRFEEQLRREVARVRRYGTPTALLLFDLDGLKRVNDTFGHPSGDELIRAVSSAVRGRLRETDAVARIGGDEFAVLLDGVDEAAALAVAEKVRRTVAELTVAVDGATVATTVSVGVATIAPDVDDAQALLATADRAMYAVKAAGGDGVATAR